MSPTEQILTLGMAGAGLVYVGTFMLWAVRVRGGVGEGNPLDVMARWRRTYLSQSPESGTELARRVAHGSFVVFAGCIIGLVLLGPH